MLQKRIDQMPQVLPGHIVYLSVKWLQKPIPARFIVYVNLERDIVKLPYVFAEYLKDLLKQQQRCIAFTNVSISDRELACDYYLEEVMDLCEYEFIEGKIMPIVKTTFEEENDSEVKPDLPKYYEQFEQEFRTIFKEDLVDFINIAGRFKLNKFKQECLEGLLEKGVPFGEIIQQHYDVNANILIYHLRNPIQIEKIKGFTRGKVCVNGITDFSKAKERALNKALQSWQNFTTGWWDSPEKPVSVCITRVNGVVTAEAIYKVDETDKLVDAAIWESFNGISYAPSADDALRKRYPGITDQQIFSLKAVIYNHTEGILTSCDRGGNNIKKSQKFSKSQLPLILKTIEQMAVDSESTAKLRYRMLVDAMKYQMNKFVCEMIGPFVFRD